MVWILCVSVAVCSLLCTVLFLLAVISVVKNARAFGLFYLGPFAVLFATK
jgi:hypothetical protein